VIVAGLAAGGFVFWPRATKAPAAAPAIADLAATAPAARAVILQTIPGAGYVQHPSTAPAAFTLAGAAVDDGAQDATAALTAAGYRNGVRQQWSNTTHAGFVSLTVFQFRSRAGATSYRQRMIAAATSKPIPPPKFPVTGVTGAVGLGPTSANRTAEVIFSRGPYLVKVLVDNGITPGAVNEATMVAVSQYTALPPQ
jgi:hypothetical protein